MRVLLACSLIALVLVVTACEPVAMFAGGELSGTDTPVPLEWSASDAVETVQLEVRPSNPYSVNIWGVGVGSDFFIASASADNRWAGYIDDNPNVRLRIGDAIYEMRALEANNPTDREIFLAAAKRKYDFEPEPEQESDARLFKLFPR